jgi:hypothetical protein
MLPLGAERFGTATPGPQGPIAIGALAMPQLGSAAFGLTSTNGPASTSGLLAVASAGLSAPVMAKNAAFWLDPAGLLLLVPVVSNAKGYSELPAPLPARPGLEGATAFVQYFWPGNPLGGFAASNALAITIQP